MLGLPPSIGDMGSLCFLLTTSGSFWFLGTREPVVAVLMAPLRSLGSSE